MKLLKLSLAALLFALSLAAPLLAESSLSLDSAKKSGLVGEQLNGYLGAISVAPTAEVKALIADINAKRLAKYKEIAQKNGTPLASVEKLAATQAIEKTESGNFTEIAPGSWKRK